LYSDRSSEYEQLLARQFLQKTKNTNMAGGLFKINILFYDDNSRIIALRQTKLGTMKDGGHA
jgi:hypothetical protein